MEKIVVVGPFNDLMKAELRNSIPETFSLEYITSKEEYGELKSADYAILRTLDFTAEDILHMDRVKLIQRWGAGYDTVNIEAAAKKNIAVAVTFGINAVPVAEMALALTLAVYRNLAIQTKLIQNGQWDRSYDKISYTVRGKTVGIVGLGSIGRKAAALYQAFGASVLYYDAYRQSAEAEAQLDVTYFDLENLWSECDIISLHAPLMPETKKMVNTQSLAKMRKGAVVINTARAELIDTEALVAALGSGHLLGAGLDALDEFMAQDKLFADLENVVLSPHLGGNTADNNALMAQRCAEQIVTISRGEKLIKPHCVNADLLR